MTQWPKCIIISFTLSHLQISEQLPMHFFIFPKQMFSCPWKEMRQRELWYLGKFTWCRFPLGICFACPYIELSATNHNHGSIFQLLTGVLKTCWVHPSSVCLVWETWWMEGRAGSRYQFLGTMSAQTYSMKAENHRNKIGQYYMFTNEKNEAWRPWMICQFASEEASLSLECMSGSSSQVSMLTDGFSSPFSDSHDLPCDYFFLFVWLLEGLELSQWTSHFYLHMFPT